MAGARRDHPFHLAKLMGFAKRSTHAARQCTVSAHELICPTGTRRKILSSHPVKNIPLCDMVETALWSRTVPCPQEGRFAVVTDVGCGMRWTQSAERNYCADERRFADGEVVWS